jgi:hypothetical protein
LVVIIGQERAGVRTSSKNFEVTIRWRFGHGPGIASSGLEVLDLGQDPAVVVTGRLEAELGKDAGDVLLHDPGEIVNSLTMAVLDRPWAMMSASTWRSRGVRTARASARRLARSRWRTTSGSSTVPPPPPR